MNDKEQQKWEWYRQGGKNRYILRNVIAWTVVLGLAPFILRPVYLLFVSAGREKWLELLSEAVIWNFFLFLVNYVWLARKWDRNEKSYQESIGGPATSLRPGAKDDSGGFVHASE